MQASAREPSLVIANMPKTFTYPNICENRVAVIHGIQIVNAFIIIILITVAMSNPNSWELPPGVMIAFYVICISTIPIALLSMVTQAGKRHPHGPKSVVVNLMLSCAWIANIIILSKGAHKDLSKPVTAKASDCLRTAAMVLSVIQA